MRQFHTEPFGNNPWRSRRSKPHERCNQLCYAAGALASFLCPRSGSAENAWASRLIWTSKACLEPRCIRSQKRHRQALRSQGGSSVPHLNPLTVCRWPQKALEFCWWHPTAPEIAEGSCCCTKQISNKIKMNVFCRDNSIKKTNMLIWRNFCVFYFLSTLITA